MRAGHDQRVILGRARIIWLIRPHRTREVCGAGLGVQFQRPIDQMTVTLPDRRQILPALTGRLHSRVVQRSVGGREVRIQRNRPFKIRHGSVRLCDREATQQGPTPQEGEISLQILAAGSGRGFGFKLPKARRQRARELVGNLILDTEDVVQSAIKMCRPNHGT